ncbi:hypothetical protein SODALDRAFT_359956 [Sodiomyces alkalinus F11]|uniref:Uncharacterized protein n=1 Tax=Sodiomyces alkalinus (strain CBS 110278 / VKM F-3762 / F11) TaxID=1314773 RepID=A0A3N2PWE5_SODAK|nr:hypothetical protein SODALDRAFT_359956 [Sodiomyces alkalinus F11]ROT38833.1 hypothetical protein SODALDRAFT_359956 [Sodiomyces alkalinus F11]
MHLWDHRCKPTQARTTLPIRDVCRHIYFPCHDSSTTGMKLRTPYFVRGSRQDSLKTHGSLNELFWEVDNPLDIFHVCRNRVASQHHKFPSSYALQTPLTLLNE